MGIYIPTGKGLGYPPLIFTDPKVAANLTDSDTRDNVTEGPQISNYVGNYCKDCVTKWPRCLCKPESDWDDDHTYSVKTQMDNPPNVENEKPPIPSDWSDQENFWNGKTYERSRTPRPKYWSISPKNYNDSDWNENLYPQNYRAKTQSQVTPR